jgi:hypothetical protein
MPIFDSTPVALILTLAVWSFRNALGGHEVLEGDPGSLTNFAYFHLPRER